MTHKILYFMIFLMTLKIAFMFYTILTPLFLNTPEEHFISYNEVSGIDIVKDNIPYTLNFDQQNAMLTFFNNNKDFTSLSKQPLDFEKMIIYRFNEPEIIIHK